MLVVIEFLTKYAWAFPLKHKSAEEIAAHLTTLICTFGPPGCLLSDQGKEFLNIVVNKLCQKFNIIKRNTSSYNPRANGQCERTNQTLTRMLIKFADDNPEDWPHSLNFALLAYRTSVHESTNHAPFELMFGRRFGQFDNWITKDKISHEQSIQNRLVEIKRLYEETHEEASKNITRAQEKQVNTQNRQTNSSHDVLMIGDTVYLKNCKLVKDKFEPQYTGPYLISDRIISSGNYKLKEVNGEEIKDSYPRWKLKATEDYSDIKAATQIEKIVEEESQEATNIENKAQKPQYSILNIQPVGRGFRYEIKYNNGKTKWIPGREMDSTILENHLFQPILSTNKYSI